MEGVDERVFSALLSTWPDASRVKSRDICVGATPCGVGCGALTLSMSQAASECGTVVHHSDASTVPPMFQPAWKATPARGRDRLNAIGGDMFSPMKLQQMFLTPNVSSEKENAEGPSMEAAPPTKTEFTFRARNVPSSTPMPSRSSSKGAMTRTTPSTPGGPHMPLRLINVPFDANIRSGLEQLAEECSREASRDEEESLSASASHSSLQDLRQNKRMRMASQETSNGGRMARFPLSYKNDNHQATPARPVSGSFPRSILKGGSLGETPRVQASRSISFMDQKHPRSTASNATAQTARMDRMLQELEQMNLSRSQPAPEDRSQMTNASFRITRDKLVEVLTDAVPWEPDWRTLKKIDLRARQLESCIALSEHLPHVQEVWLDHNQVSFAMGIPSSVRLLTASHNVMSELTSFEHLKRLRVLDVCHNEFASLMPFVHLTELRELRADHNRITDLRGLEQCTSLRRLSLAHNELGGCVDVSGMCWPALESWSLAHNRIHTIAGLESVAALQELDADDNQLTTLPLTRTMPQLRVLRLCDNTALDTLDVSCMPHLRVLYADRCRLASIEALSTARDLRHLSLRQQGTRVRLPLPVPRSLQRLYFSGNAVRANQLFLSPMPSLVYLELAGCQLTSVSSELQDQTPALRSLNMDHSLFTSLPSLRPWRRLKRLSIVGCRIDTLESIVRSIHGMTELCVLDLRTNPCTLGLYPPMILPLNAPDGTSGPPVPHPAIVQPDAARAAEQAAQTRLRAVQSFAERSQFHKRTMLVPPEPTVEAPVESEHVKDSARTASLFHAADKHFQSTLPGHLLQKRRVYRGLCGMACNTLTWLDGLEIDEQDILRAEQQLRRLDRDT